MWPVSKEAKGRKYRTEGEGVSLKANRGTVAMPEPALPISPGHMLGLARLPTQLNTPVALSIGQRAPQSRFSRRRVVIGESRGKRTSGQSRSLQGIYHS
jgi:hypothetical protein